MARTQYQNVNRTLVISRHSGDVKNQLDKTVLSPESQLKSPDKTPPANAESTENVSPEQTESAQTTPLVSNIIQQESPGESQPDIAQPTENVGPDQMVQPQPAPSVQSAIIQFAITPWGEVYVDGKRKGASPPLTSVPIAPGKHRIEIRNTAFPPYFKTYEFKPNEKLKISHKF